MHKLSNSRGVAHGGHMHARSAPTLTPFCIFIVQLQELLQVANACLDACRGVGETAAAARISEPCHLAQCSTAAHNSRHF